MTDREQTFAARRSRYPWPHARRIGREISWWLCAHSKLYRKFVAWRWKRAMRRLERALGEKFAPACHKAARAIGEWGEAWEKVNRG